AAIAVSATVNALCQIGSGSSASQDYATAVRNAQSGVKIRCDMNVPYTVSVDVKTSDLTESIPVTTTSNADASLQTVALPPSNSTGRGLTDARMDGFSAVAGGRHVSDLGSGSRTDFNVVVTTVTY
ncbi:MAG: hypothetical protein ACRYG8_44035, partial [Janthinobacterium lividum]